MKTPRLALFLVALMLLALAPAATAQFRGDMFFADPVISVPEGGTGTFEVLLFAGADVVGASHFEVLFDPAQAEIVSLEPGESVQLDEAFASLALPGRAAIANLNDASLTRPIGTVSLARLTFRALAPAGTRVPLSIAVRSLLRQSDSAPLFSRGFSGEIVVVSARAPSPSQLSARGSLSAEAVVVDAADRRRALELAPAGTALELLDLVEQDGLYAAVPRRVSVADPAAPSEAPIR